MFEFGDTFREQTDFALYWIGLISLLCTIGIGFAMVLFSVKYSRRNNPVASNIEGNHTLEIIWTVIPSILVFWFFWIGWEGYKTDREVPEGAMVIEVEGYKWGWNFKYANGKVSSDPYVPQGVPVKFILHTKDVVHSFYLPYFRTKRDAMPGYENYVWLQADSLGNYDIFCTEYCGKDHWNMNRKMYVITKEEFDVWYNTKSKDRSGEEIFKAQCASCHSLDGAKGVGPSFKGLYELKDHKVVVGAETKLITVDEAYLKEAIIEPNASIVDGYAPGMPAFNTLTEQEMTNIVDYIKSVK
jgi:cytochrome c oxidase subunit 2